MTGIPTKVAIQIASRDERLDLFCKFARYFPDLPSKPYAIRIGSQTFFAEDTAILMGKFIKAIAALKKKGRKR